MFGGTVDGGWSSWEAWSQMTVSCGSGLRERRRRCDYPRPNYCGASCTGREVDTEVHDTGRSCPECGAYVYKYTTIFISTEQNSNHHYAMVQNIYNVEKV